MIHAVRCKVSHLCPFSRQESHNYGTQLGPRLKRNVQEISGSQKENETIDQVFDKTSRCTAIRCQRKIYCIRRKRERKYGYQQNIWETRETNAKP